MSGWSTGSFNSFLAKFKADYDGCVIDLCAGTTLSEDADLTGRTVLATATLNGDGVTGLTWDTPVANEIAKPLAAVWRYTGLADGTAAWFLIRQPADTLAASTTDVRYIGSVGRTSGELQISNVNVVTGAPGTVDTASLTLSNV